jgi:hypothetical protein
MITTIANERRLIIMPWVFIKQDMRADKGNSPDLSGLIVDYEYSVPVRAFILTQYFAYQLNRIVDPSICELDFVSLEDSFDYKWMDIITKEFDDIHKAFVAQLLTLGLTQFETIQYTEMYSNKFVEGVKSGAYRQDSRRHMVDLIENELPGDVAVIENPHVADSVYNYYKNVITLLKRVLLLEYNLRTALGSSPVETDWREDYYKYKNNS